MSTSLSFGDYIPFSAHIQFDRSEIKILELLLFEDLPYGMWQFSTAKATIAEYLNNSYVHFLEDHPDIHVTEGKVIYKWASDLITYPNEPSTLAWKVQAIPKSN